MDSYREGCPDPGFGPACKSHTEELLDLSHDFRDAINEAKDPGSYQPATDQLDWADDWAGRGLESKENQAGVSLSLSLIREWGDMHWTK